MTAVKRSTPAAAEQMIDALIPPPLPQPCPAPPPLPSLPPPTVRARLDQPELDIARLDPSGRLSARALLLQLGWRPGHPVRFDTVGGIIVVTSTRTGHHLVGARGQLAVPAPLRQLCALEPGDLVVVAADTTHDILVIHPAHVVASLLAQRYTELTQAHHGG